MGDDRSLITVQRIEDFSGFHDVERLQEVVWGFGPREVVPAHVLYIAGTSGGIVAGAYQHGTLVGFVLGFLGHKDGRLCHISHMLGVHPDCQGQGIGEQLKWYQRKCVLEQGIDLMTWTYDPLEARNAHFNLHKLGASSRTYHENLYGDLGGTLNRALPTDRLLVEWRLNEERRSHDVHDPAVVLDDVEGRPSLQLDRYRDGEACSAVVPRDIQGLKRDDPGLALAWRLALRDALTWLFARGYVVRDFVDGAYLLIQENTP